MIKRRTAVSLALSLTALSPLTSLAADPQLKIGSLVPKNSLYHRQLMEIGESWKKSQSGSSRFNVFTDGSQGGEAEMVRRMRIGQLQAALLSVVGLREIEPSIAALQNLPLAFRSWEELDYVREKMRPNMEKKVPGERLCCFGLGRCWMGALFFKTSRLQP
jgi:TRAP-type transport system periplasmic protein